MVSSPLNALPLSWALILIQTLQDPLYQINGIYLILLGIRRVYKTLPPRMIELIWYYLNFRLYQTRL